jgi:two-component system, OmpR family, phosphate regulon sensor histidine kinase PhoR
MLVGVLVMQAGWIARVMQLNQKAFDNAVYKALAAVVKEVEEKENFGFIKRQVETNDKLQKTKKFLKEHAQAKKRKTRIVAGENNLRISMTETAGGQTKTVVRIENDDNGNHYVHNSVFVGAAVLDTPRRPRPPAPPALHFVTVDDKKENVELILEKMLSISDPDSLSIQPAEIEKMLVTQLRQNNLPAQFAFALLSKDPKKSYVSHDTSVHGGWAPYQVKLYPNDLFGRQTTLALMFPVEATRVGFDMWGAMGVSLFFTIALLFLFIYSIRMLQRHKKMLEMKNDFINHMSHEFKTPLAGISLGADMLLTKPGQLTSDDIHKVASTIKKQSARLNSEVNDVLQNALLEESIGRPHAIFNLAELIRRELELFQPQIDSKCARVNLSLCADTVLFTGNEQQWHKVISNLLDNALKFSGQQAEISITLKASGPRILLEVADNGAGIAAADLPRIFDKFFRSDYYRKSNIQGFGLGLNFVKTVVTQHKGAIRAESELNAGTRIIIGLNAEA